MDTQHTEGELGGHTEAVVYGEDDRHEVYADVGEASELATRSVVALIPASEVEKSAAHSVQVNPPSLKDMLMLCDGERYAEQPSAAHCSGVLIDRDLVLTAGHCFEDEDRCDTFAYVFNYNYSRRDQASVITDLEAYGCKRIVARAHARDQSSLRDFAIVELDRPVSANRQEVGIASSLPEVGDALTVIGFPQGVPAKIDAGGHVQSVLKAAGYFTVDSDTFGGSSGSPVFDEDDLLSGIVVQGQDDYVLDEGAGCMRARRVEESEGSTRYERVVDLRAALDALCRADSTRTWACMYSLGPDADPLQGYVGCAARPRVLGIADHWPAVLAVLWFARRRRRRTRRNSTCD